MLQGGDPAKKQPKLLPAGIMPWLGEGHIRGSEDWLDVSQPYVPDCPHHPTLTLHWEGPS